MAAHQSDHRKESASVDVERAFERLAEDETLRGDLTDLGYGPLLGWVAALAVARAARFASTDDLSLALRRLIAGAVAAAEQGAVGPLFAAIAPPLFTAAELSALRAAPPALTAEPDASALAIVRRLASITGVPAPA